MPNAFGREERVGKIVLVVVQTEKRGFGVGEMKEATSCCSHGRIVEGFANKVTVAVVKGIFLVEGEGDGFGTKGFERCANSMYGFLATSGGADSKLYIRKEFFDVGLKHIEHDEAGESHECLANGDGTKFVGVIDGFDDGGFA